MKSRIPPVDESTSFLRQYLNEYGDNALENMDLDDYSSVDGPVSDEDIMPL